MIILVVIYMTALLAVYTWMFLWLSKQNRQHPEMEEVKAGESLLTMKYHGSLRALRPEQHPDLGFAEFLANRDSGNRDHDDS
jgi:Flp pilus assembly protein TadB